MTCFQANLIAKSDTAADPTMPIPPAEQYLSNSTRDSGGSSMVHRSALVMGAGVTNTFDDHSELLWELEARTRK